MPAFAVELLLGCCGTVGSAAKALGSNLLTGLLTGVEGGKIEDALLPLGETGMFIGGDKTFAGCVGESATGSGGGVAAGGLLDRGVIGGMGGTHDGRGGVGFTTGGGRTEAVAEGASVRSSTLGFWIGRPLGFPDSDSIDDEALGVDGSRRAD